MFYDILKFDPTDVPDFHFPAWYHYVMFAWSPYTCQELKVYKSLNAFRHQQADAHTLVKDIKVFSDSAILKEYVYLYISEPHCMFETTTCPIWWTLGCHVKYHKAHRYYFNYNTNKKCLWHLIIMFLGSTAFGGDFCLCSAAAADCPFSLVGLAEIMGPGRILLPAL